METRKPDGPLPGVHLSEMATERLSSFATGLRRVERQDFRGDVYDFQTAHGAILAESVCISNCRCSTIELDQQDVEDGGYDVADADDFADLLAHKDVWDDDKLEGLVHGPDAPMRGVDLIF